MISQKTSPWTTAVLLTACLAFLLASYGCSAVNNVNLGGQKTETNAKAPQPAPPAPKIVPIFQYNYKGQPVEAGKVVEVTPDGKVLIESTLPSGEVIQWPLDPLGWLLVAPVSPINKPPDNK